MELTQRDTPIRSPDFNGASRIQNRWDNLYLESPFSAPIPWDCTAHEANCKTNTPFVVEKPGDSVPSAARPPIRERCSSISPISPVLGSQGI